MDGSTGQKPAHPGHVTHYISTKVFVKNLNPTLSVSFPCRGIGFTIDKVYVGWSYINILAVTRRHQKKIEKLLMFVIPLLPESYVTLNTSGGSAIIRVNITMLSVMLLF